MTLPNASCEAAFFGNDPARVAQVYGAGRRETIEREMGLRVLPGVVSGADFDALAPELGSLRWIFSTWGMPALGEEQVRCLPRLEAVFYAAGSVQHFARPFLAAGAQVISAWAVNAIPVAQMVLAQILLGLKGYFHALRACRSPESQAAFQNRHHGTFEATVSILGAGMIGSRVIELLRPHGMEVLVFDPFLSPARAAELGAQQVSLEEAFMRGHVVSNHVANLPETVGMIRGGHFESMRPYATFINTGRGASLDEPAMLAVMARRPDLTTLLDVTWPEPPLPESPIYRLENVLLTPHIGGNMGHETLRQADCVIEEFRRLRAGLPLRYAVTMEMLKTMA